MCVLASANGVWVCDTRDMSRELHDVDLAEVKPLVEKGETITGLLQEFDVQASRGRGLLFYPPVHLSPPFFFPSVVSLCSFGAYPGTRSGDQAGLELAEIRLILPPEC
ncbi:protein NDRG1 [Cricetulus griseus]|nr:protein NDRG1 [Cricetulus griseus]